MSGADYNLYNVPALLARSVKKQDPSNPDQWIRDESWYREVQDTYYSLFCFLQSNGLVSRELVKAPSDTAAVVVKASELSERGSRFVKSGADERWLKSFDRAGSGKDFSNTAYLSKALAKLDATAEQ